MQFIVSERRTLSDILAPGNYDLKCSVLACSGVRPLSIGIKVLSSWCVMLATGQLEQERIHPGSTHLQVQIQVFTDSACLRSHSIL